MDAPSAEELKDDPIVKAAFEAAWEDSFPDDPALRHEEGGFIYANPTTGEIFSSYPAMTQFGLEENLQICGGSVHF